MSSAFFDYTQSKFCRFSVLYILVFQLLTWTSIRMWKICRISNTILIKILVLLNIGLLLFDFL